MDALITPQEAFLLNNLTSVPTNLKNFNTKLVEYFRVFWDKHSLEKDWFRKNTDHYMTEEKPVFHGLVLSGDSLLLKWAKKGITNMFAADGISFVETYSDFDGIHNRGGEFTFLNVNDVKNVSLPQFLNGKTYDLILVFNDLEITDEMRSTLLSITRYKLLQQIVFIQTKDT